MKLPEQLIIYLSVQYPPNKEFARVFVMGFRGNWTQSLSIPQLRPGSGRAVENKADLSQQFADSVCFCSLLKLSSYKQHKWYLYPPIMPSGTRSHPMPFLTRYIYTMLSRQFALLVATPLMTGMCL